MSTLAVDTLTARDGTLPIAQSVVFSGTAKAWWRILANGTAVGDRGISSIDDDGTGDRGLHLSASFSTANYACLQVASDGGTSTLVREADLTDTTQAAGSFDLETSGISSSANRTNADVYSWGSVLGDLA
jgi:hypothetical protein